MCLFYCFKALIVFFLQHMEMVYLWIIYAISLCCVFLFIFQISHAQVRACSETNVVLQHPTKQQMVDSSGGRTDNQVPLQTH